YYPRIAGPQAGWSSKPLDRWKWTYATARAMPRCGLSLGGHGAACLNPSCECLHRRIGSVTQVARAPWYPVHFSILRSIPNRIATIHDSRRYGTFPGQALSCSVIAPVCTLLATDNYAAMD